MDKFINYDEILLYALKIAENYFLEFDIGIDKTQEVKDRLFERIRFKIKDEYNITQLSNIDSQEKVKSIVYNITKQVFDREDIAKFLNILPTNIRIIDDNFYIGGASFDRQSKSYLRLEINKFSFGICKYPLCFDNYKFTNIIVENPVMQRNYANISFKSCEFLESVVLSNSTIKIDHTLEMKNCIFYKAVKINNKIFDSNAYFNNSTFKDYVDFHESKFNQTACFYGVTFEKVPNFSQTIFNGNLNLVNSKLNFGFKECKEAVENELDRRTIITSIPNTKFPVLYEVANDFRDSFRIFKNALIKDNNLLDASNYHKIELYFKEIELDSKKPKFFSKEWIDFWQLKLYRLTSNHHTDLLRIFSCIVILIGCFATTLFFAEYYGNPNIWYGIFWATFGLVSIFTAFGKISYLGFFTLLSLVPCAWLVSYNPKYIFGVASLFGNNNCNGVFLNFAFSIYTILFILLIFSLQKTARRNSIIPT